MILRIPGKGQYESPATSAGRLKRSGTAAVAFASEAGHDGAGRICADRAGGGRRGDSILPAAGLVRRGRSSQTRVPAG